MNKTKIKHTAKQVGFPDRISSYFSSEKAVLAAVTLSGLIYNAGMTAGPWFEGRLAQTLGDIINGKKQAGDMLSLALLYTLVILLVQLMRAAKRFYVRRFANNVSRNMKLTLYGNLVHLSTAELENADTGALMTKALSDVDACAEGMRKFTTEVFDTGVVLICYFALMLSYDVRLALIASVFPPVAYLIAERLKKPVAKNAAAYKKSAERLNGETLERVGNELSYRVLSVSPVRDAAYRVRLREYRKRAAVSGVLETALQPLYQIISSISFIFIIYFGIKNVRGTGWCDWDTAAFVAFVSCFSRLALKSSKAAKLFNAVQKARVSWGRIKPLMKSVPEELPSTVQPPAALEVKNLTLFSHDGSEILKNVCFTASPGQIIGITGPVACGKSTLGRAFLCEKQYSGEILFGGKELSSLSPGDRRGITAYMGHEPQLLSASIQENITLGDTSPDSLGSLREMLRLCEIAGEVDAMPEKGNTPVGSGGVRLSGGQQARLALARTFYRPRPLTVLDDPFSALDRNTEKAVFANLRAAAGTGTILLISHRLGLFPQTDKVLWIENGTLTQSTHEKLFRENEHYRALYLAQDGGEEK